MYEFDEILSIDESSDLPAEAMIAIGGWHDGCVSLTPSAGFDFKHLGKSVIRKARYERLLRIEKKIRTRLGQSLDQKTRTRLEALLGKVLFAAGGLKKEIARDAITSAFHQASGLEILGGEYDYATGFGFSDIAGAVSGAVRGVTRAVKKAVKAAGGAIKSIPGVGAPFHSILSFATSPFSLAEKVLSGKRIDKAFLGTLKDNLDDARDLAPYAKLIVTSVPGVGTGIAGAIGAATAIAQGRPITDIAMAAVREALPGGEAAQAAFDAAKNIAKGKKVTSVMLSAARDRLPKEARAAFDTGLAVAQGKKMQDALIRGVARMTPANMVPLAKAGAQLVSAKGPLGRVRAKLDKQEKLGFDIANGALARSGVPEHALMVLRKKLGPNARQGFDAALLAQSKLAKKSKRVEKAQNILAKLKRAKTIESQGHRMDPAALALLTKFRNTRDKARAGDPMAVAVMRALSEAQKLPAVAGVGFGAGAEALAAIGFEPRVIAPGRPTGDIFIGFGCAGVGHCGEHAA